MYFAPDFSFSLLISPFSLDLSPLPSSSFHSQWFRPIDGSPLFVVFSIDHPPRARCVPISRKPNSAVYVSLCTSAAAEWPESPYFFRFFPPPTFSPYPPLVSCAWYLSYSAVTKTSPALWRIFGSPLRGDRTQVSFAFPSFF